MREIKFKVWIKKNQKMILPDGYEYELVYGTSYKQPLHLVKIYEYSPAEIIDSKIMQYTGLKDSNDKEIYEGDIMKVNIGGYEEIGIIEYVEEKAGFFWKHPKDDTYYELDILSQFTPFEVIGNKYE